MHGMPPPPQKQPEPPQQRFPVPWRLLNHSSVQTPPEPDALSHHCFGSAAGFSAFADDTTRTTVAASAFR